MGWPFGVRRPLKRFRFTATDVDWAAGDGPEVTGPVDALLLLTDGLRAAPLRRRRGAVWTGQAVAGPRRTSDNTTAAAANSPEKTRLRIVCLRGVCSHFSRRTDRPV